MRITCFLAAAPLLVGASASSAATSQSPTDTIVVRGTRIDPADARTRAVEFVKRAGVAKGEKQVSRWLVPVCIKVIGLQDTQAENVKQTMLAIAREARIRTGGPKCEPNITASFTADAKGVVRQIHSKKPHQLRELPLPDRERVLNGDSPIRWWYSTQQLDRDGVKANNTSAPWLSGAGYAGKEGQGGADPVGLPMLDDVTSTQQYNSGSNVRTPTMRSLYGATVVVDATKVGKTSLDAIAAYAALVAFAEMDASDPPPPDSVLGLFQPNSIETSLTDWDMAFLKSLYRMPLDRRGRIQRGHLVEALLDERLPDQKKKKKTR